MVTSTGYGVMDVIEPTDRPTLKEFWSLPAEVSCHHRERQVSAAMARSAALQMPSVGYARIPAAQRPVAILAKQRLKEAADRARREAERQQMDQSDWLSVDPDPDLPPVADLVDEEAEPDEVHPGSDVENSRPPAVPQWGVPFSDCLVGHFAVVDTMWGDSTRGVEVLKVNATSLLFTLPYFVACISILHPLSQVKSKDDVAETFVGTPYLCEKLQNSTECLKYTTLHYHNTTILHIHIHIHLDRSHTHSHAPLPGPRGTMPHTEPPKPITATMSLRTLSSSGKIRKSQRRWSTSCGNTAIGCSPPPNRTGQGKWGRSKPNETLCLSLAVMAFQSWDVASFGCPTLEHLSR